MSEAKFVSGMDSLIKKTSDTISNENIRNSMLYTFFLFVNNGLSFFLLLLLANYLIPADYGKLNLFTTFVALLQIIISLSTSGYISVAFFRNGKSDIQKIIITIIGVSTIILLLLEIIINAKFLNLGHYLGIPVYIASMGILICYFQVVNLLNIDLYRLEEKPISYGLYNFSYALINFFLTLCFVIELKSGWTGRAHAWLIASFIYFLISTIYLIRRGYIRLTIPSVAIIKDTLYYALPLIPHSVSYWIKQGADKYILNYYYDSEVVGYFSFAMTLASIIVMFGTAFNSSNSVYIFKNLKLGYHNVANKLKKQEKIMTLIFSCLGVITIIIVCFFLPIFFNKYVDSIKYLIPLMIGAIAQCLYLLYVNYLFYYKKTLYLMYISLGTGLIQIILSLILTKYSSMYTAYISMIISIIATVSVYLYYRRLVEKGNYNATQI